VLARNTLAELLACHATPGDEGEVRAVLERRWRAAGLRITRLGDQAVIAALPSAAGSRRPVLLVTAHMDSPGFIVDRRIGDAVRPGAAGLVRLGYPACTSARTPGVLKTRSGRTPVVIGRRKKGGSCDYWCAPVSRGARLPDDLEPGDRVCFAPPADEAIRGDLLAAPFLDNRLGCWLLAELASSLAAWRTPFRIVLGATAAEELGGFGAPVLARHVQPDAVIVLDATYAAPEQRVAPGGGPVLTLSDASVLLSPARRDWVRGRLAADGIPLQTEAYDFSGTDARAFPHQGLACPVLPLLIATTGNHTPRETADPRDAEQTAAAIRCLAAEPWP